MADLQAVIISGLSGAGKTVAMQCFEDMGYYCVDNLPPALIPTFLDLFEHSDEFNKVAMVIDLRAREFFDDFKSILDSSFEHLKIQPTILFLEASELCLVSRYKETRRSHPLSTQGRVTDGILKEKELLADIKSQADIVIDTTDMNSRTLRQRLMQKFSSDQDQKFCVNFLSFGFKHALPVDADLVMDVRFLPNPHYIKELRPKTGLDDEVYEYVMDQADTQEFYEKFTDLLDFLLPRYKKEGKSNLTLALGCTGGKHRSVALTERLAQKYQAAGYSVNVTHRDKDRE